MNDMREAEARGIILKLKIILMSISSEINREIDCSLFYCLSYTRHGQIGHS